MSTKSLEETVSPEDARELIAAGDAQAVDIRDDEQWEESRIPGATHLSEEELAKRMSDLPDDAAIVVVCADGDASAEVAAKLREEGHEAASIKGGMKAYEGERLPLQPRPDEEFEGPDYSKPPGV